MEQEQRLERLKKQRKQLNALTQGEKRRRHDHLHSTIPQIMRTTVDNEWREFILRLEQALNQLDLQIVGLEKKISPDRQIIHQEELRRKQGEGYR